MNVVLLALFVSVTAIFVFGNLTLGSVRAQSDQLALAGGTRRSSQEIVLNGRNVQKLAFSSSRQLVCWK